MNHMEPITTIQPLACKAAATSVAGVAAGCLAPALAPAVLCTAMVFIDFATAVALGRRLRRAGRSRGQTVVGSFRESCSHSWAYLWRTGAGSSGAVLRCAARFGFRPRGLCGRRGVFLAASVDSRKRIDMLGRPVGTGGTALSHRQGPAPPAITSNACSEFRGRRLTLKPIKGSLRLCVQV